MNQIKFADHRIGRHVLALRHERVWTRRDLADRAGVSYGTVTRIENKKIHPNITTIQKIARALGVESVEIMRAPR